MQKRRRERDEKKHRSKIARYKNLSTAGLGGCRNLVATWVFLGCEKPQPGVATGGCRMDSEVATYVSQLQPPTILGGWEV